MSAVEITIAYTKPAALDFAIAVLGVGLFLRAYSHKLSGLKTLTITREVAAMVSPNLPETMRPHSKKVRRSWSRPAASIPC